jgi:glutamate formiminotransferase
MLRPVLECVVNVSEGRRADVIAHLRDAAGATLLDVHTDADHHRSVFTMADDDAAAVQAGVRDLARQAIALVDLRTHTGVHPRLGVVDVVPFVALDPTTTPTAVAAAHDCARFLAGELGVPVFFYGAADAANRALPSVRADAFVRRPPDLGPAAPHPSAGATAVGVRSPLVAVNCELATDAITIARAIARAVRERDGGLRGVRALGFELASRRSVQVSMNLTDLDATGLEVACAAVEGEARRHATRVVAIELVGLLPASELARCSASFAARLGLTDEQTIEGRAKRWR